MKLVNWIILKHCRYELTLYVLEKNIYFEGMWNADKI